MAKYDDWIDGDGILRITAWTRDGLTMEQVAGNIGINITTLYDWRRMFPQVAQALKRGREAADIEIENALYKRAYGYDYVERMVETNPKGTVIREVTKHVAPDVTAQIFWLKNRRPEAWRDRKEQLVQDDKTTAGVVEIAEVVIDAEKQ